MSKPYPIELRNQVIASYNEGKKVAEIVRGLNVKQSSVYNMLKSYKATGRVPAPAKTGRKPAVK